MKTAILFIATILSVYGQTFQGTSVRGASMWSGSGPTAYTVLAHTMVQAGSSPVTTTGINTTGADIIWVWTSLYTNNGTFTVTVSDSNSNSWTCQTANTYGGGYPTGQLCWTRPTTVGAGHTFTASSASAINGIVGVIAASGSVSSPVDSETHVTGASGGATNTTGNLPSYTPSVNNCIIIFGFATGNAAAGTVSVSSPFTITDQIDNTASAQGGALAYLIQTTATAETPSYTWTNSGNNVTYVAQQYGFKP